ncbi:DcaP family trimeric outer membrane transporter [Luteimonas sp. e5]
MTYRDLPPNRRRLPALAIALALLAPGTALAQSPREAELEARVAELERIVARLSAQQQQTVERLEQARDEATAAPPLPAPGAAPMQAATPGTTFSYGGFIKFDAMLTDTDGGKIADGTAGRMFHLPAAIPVGGVAAVDPYADFGAQFSRFWFSADHASEDGHKVKAYIEADFFGGGSANLGNETSTNTHGVTLRHAYVSWNEWLAGQTWSNFMDVAALPDAVDFVGVSDGTVFVRQAQLRYSRGPWSFSLENPQTTVQGYQGAPRYNSGDNAFPDFTARWQQRGDWGHVSVAALLRQFKVPSDYRQGVSLSVSGKANLGPDDDIRFALNHGRGIGRYLAFGLAPDVAIDLDGGLHPVDGSGGFVAWRHVFAPRLRGNLMAAAARIDNPVDYTGLGITRSSHSLHANLIWSPIPRLDLGAEIGWGERKLESGQSGDFKRVHTSVKYSF